MIHQRDAFVGNRFRFWYLSNRATRRYRGLARSSATIRYHIGERLMLDAKLQGKMFTAVSIARLVARLLTLAAILLAGCGYHFAGSGSNLPRDAKTIYVSKFTNHTRMTGVNDEFMHYLDDEIASRKRLTLVDNPRDADLSYRATLWQI